MQKLEAISFLSLSLQIIYLSIYLSNTRSPPLSLSLKLTHVLTHSLKHTLPPPSIYPSLTHTFPFSLTAVTKLLLLRLQCKQSLRSRLKKMCKQRRAKDFLNKILTVLLHSLTPSRSFVWSFVDYLSTNLSYWTTYLQLLFLALRN